MATFQYIAKDSSGNEQRGTVEAGDRNSAIAAVRAQGLLPTALGEVKGTSPKASSPQGGKAKAPKAKLVWTPSTPLKDSVRTAKVRTLNAIAAKVIAEFNDIAVDDLFVLMDPCDRDEEWTDPYHFKPPAVTRQAQQVVSACLRAAGL